MKKFLIVDDHRLFLEGMQHILQSLDDDVYVDTTDTVSDALIKIEEPQNQYDLLLLDISLPEMNGFSLIQSLNQRGIILPIIIVSSTSELADIRKCLELGASGFIHKNTSSSEMLVAVERVLNGGVALPENLSSQLDIALRPDCNEQLLLPTAPHKVGERQIEVLKLIDQGMSNKQIAKILAISEATVKYHIGILFKKFGVRNRTSCLIEARKEKFLNP